MIFLKHSLSVYFIFHLPVKTMYSFCLSFYLRQAWVPDDGFDELFDEFFEKELRDAGKWSFYLFIHHHDLPHSLSKLLGFLHQFTT